jgi:hypothetical protein
MKLFIEGHFEKISRHILALDRKEFRLVIGLPTGHCTLRWHPHIMGLSDNAKCRKCEYKEESSYHILCQCPVLKEHRIKIFGCAWLELTDISRASVI